MFRELHEKLTCLLKSLRAARQKHIAAIAAPKKRDSGGDMN